MSILETCSKDDWDRLSIYDALGKDYQRPATDENDILLQDDGV